MYVIISILKIYHRRLIVRNLGLATVNKVSFRTKILPKIEIFHNDKYQFTRKT